MIVKRPFLNIVRGSGVNIGTFESSNLAPIVNLTPYEHLFVRYDIRYQIFLVPMLNKEDEARAMVRHFVIDLATFQGFAVFELLQNDWSDIGFRERDYVAIYATPNLSNILSERYRIYGIVDDIRGSQMSLRILAIDTNGNLVNPPKFMYLYAFVIDYERRNRTGNLPLSFITQIRRQGDVSGDVSPLSGLYYAEPHANGIEVLNDAHLIEPLPSNPLLRYPWTGIVNENPPGTGILIDTIIIVSQEMDGWTSIPASRRPVTTFRNATRRIKIANFFSYREQYNTLANFAQREFYHENADLITKLVLNDDDREISIPLRLRLLHANVRENGTYVISPPDLTVPTIQQGAGLIVSQIQRNPSRYQFLSAHFALTTDNDEHHTSKLILNQHDLTRFRNAFAFSVGPNIQASISAATILNDLRRNPFETYVVAIWRFRDLLNNEEICVLSDALPVSIDENISKILTFSNDASLRFPYARFDTFLVSFAEETEKFGEYQIYIRARRDANSPEYTIQQYTFKVDESNIVNQTSTFKEFYCLHYAHKYPTIVAAPNYAFCSDKDVFIERVSPTQYNHYFSIPVPSFDLPIVKKVDVRPQSGSLYDWFLALNAPTFTIQSGTLIAPNPINVADADIRIYMITPENKIYATNWRKIRAREKSNSLNLHWCNIIETSNTIFVVFPGTGSPPNIIKASAKLFQENISSLKPLAEASADQIAGTQYSTGNGILSPAFIGGFVRLFAVNKNNLPTGRYKLHVIARYDDGSGDPYAIGEDGYQDDVDYSFTIGKPLTEFEAVEKQECCYQPPLIQAETIKYISFDAGTNTYSQNTIIIPPASPPPNSPAWNDFVSAYECCFKIYDNPSILRENFVDVIALFDNRINNIPIVGEHWFRFRGFATLDSYEIESESYTRASLEEEPVLRTFRKRYKLELFLSDCDIKALDFQKLARRWRIRNYTNSLLPPEFECLVQNIELTTQYNKLKATITLIEVKPEEYRHR